MYNTMDKYSRDRVNRGFHNLKEHSQSVLGGAQEASYKIPFNEVAEKLVVALNKTKDAIAVNTAEMKSRRIPILESYLPDLVYGVVNLVASHETAVNAWNQTPRLATPGMAALEAKNTMLRAQAEELAEALLEAYSANTTDVDGGGL